MDVIIAVIRKRKDFSSFNFQISGDIIITNWDSTFKAPIFSLLTRFVVFDSTFPFELWMFF